MDTATKKLIGNVKKFVNYWSSEEVSVEKDELGNEECREALIKMSRTVTNVWTLTSVRKTSISVNGRWFRTYLTDALGPVTKSYVEQVLDEGHIQLQRISTEKYEICKEMEKVKVVVSSNEDKRSS